MLNRLIFLVWSSSSAAAADSGYYFVVGWPLTLTISQAFFIESIEVREIEASFIKKS